MAIRQTRRTFLRQTGALGAATLASGLPRVALAQPIARMPAITMVINQSPWFDGFRQLVGQYQKETGNRIELDVNPYAGALDKIRNSLRAAPARTTFSRSTTTGWWNSSTADSWSP